MTDPKRAVHYTVVAEHHNYDRLSVEEIERSLNTLSHTYDITGEPVHIHGAAQVGAVYKRHTKKAQNP